MKILFNNIPYIKTNSVGVTTPSFCAKNSNKDEFVKSYQASDFDYSDYYASILNEDFSDSKDLSSLPEEILKRVKEEYVIEGFVDALAQRGVAHSLRMNHPRQPIKEYIDMISANQQVSDLLFDTFSKAGINTAGDLGRVMEVYTNPKVKKHYEKANIDFFEIYGELKNKSDMIAFPDFLLHFKDIAYEKDITDTKQMFDDVCTVFDDLGVRDTDDFCSKFYHLAPAFNDYENMSDCCDALGFILQTYDQKIALLTPIAEKNKSNNKLNSPQKIYSSIPEVIDTLYEYANGQGLFDIEDYIDLAISNKNFNAKTLSYVDPYFNSFNAPTDDLRFYRLLKNSDLSVNNTNRLFSKIIFSDVEPMNLINNMQNIVGLLAEKDKMNYQLAKDLYINFADVFNAAYNAENSSSDVLNDTYNLVKTCKFKDSSDLLNFYNQVNLPNKKSKAITSENFIEFIDLMRFVKKDELLDSKKVKKIRLEELRQLRNEYNSISAPIEEFLLNNSKNLFLNETSLSIFNKYSKELIGVSEEEINSKLFELDKLNIKNIEEYNQKNSEMEKFDKFFPSRKELVRFVVNNQISFEKTPEEEEYKENCYKILELLHDLDESEDSYELIKKLSNSRFLLKSKSSLKNIFVNSQTSTNAAITVCTLLNKKIKNYATFESFVQKYEVDKSSHNKLIDYLTEMPNDVKLSEISAKLDVLNEQLINSNFPIGLNANNIINLSYDDLLTCKKEDKTLNLDVLNKLLDIPYDANPVIALKRAYAVQGPIRKSDVAKEIFTLKKDSDNYPKLVNFLYPYNDLSSNMSSAEVKKFSYFIPDSFIDFLTSMSRTSNGMNYNMSLHSKLRIVERFLMDDIKTDSDFTKIETKQKLDNLLNSIYKQKPLLIKKSGDEKRILFNTKYDGKVIESVFAKDGMLITAVEKSH